MDQKMNQEVKKLWVDALRSGEYKQGSSVLHDYIDNTYCCLGVLCHLATLQKIEEGSHHFVITQRLPDSSSMKYGNEGATEVLPVEVQLWAGLSGPNPDISIEDSYCGNKDNEPITELNDSYKYDFNTLANLIEDQL